MEIDSLQDCLWPNVSNFICVHSVQYSFRSRVSLNNPGTVPAWKLIFQSQVTAVYWNTNQTVQDMSIYIAISNRTALNIARLYLIQFAAFIMKTMLPEGCELNACTNPSVIRWRHPNQMLSQFTHLAAASHSDPRCLSSVRLKLGIWQMDCASYTARLGYPTSVVTYCGERMPRAPYLTPPPCLCEKHWTLKVLFVLPTLPWKLE